MEKTSRNTASQAGWTVVLLTALLAQPALAQSKAQLNKVVNRLHASLDEIALQAAGTANQTGVSVEIGGGNAVLSFANEDKGWTFKLSTPVTSDADAADFATLDGLAGTLTASYSISGSLPMKKPQSGWVDSADFDAEQYSVANLRGPYTAGQRAQYRALLTESKRTNKWGLEAEVGHREAEYFNAAGVAQKDDKLSYSLSASLATQGDKDRFTFEAALQSKYEDTASVRRCDAVGGSPNLETCKDLPLGAPPRNESLILTAQWRVHGLCESRPPLRCRLGLAPTVARDLDANVTGVELPIYVLNTGVGLSGGIRLGWRSDERDLTASVFISKPFKLGD